MSTCKKKKDLPPFTKINSKLVTDPNVKYKMIKLEGDKEGHLGFSNQFLDTTSKSLIHEKNLIGWTLIKFKTYAL